MNSCVAYSSSLFVESKEMFPGYTEVKWSQEQIVKGFWSSKNPDLFMIRDKTTDCDMCGSSSMANAEWTQNGRRKAKQVQVRVVTCQRCFHKEVLAMLNARPDQEYYINYCNRRWAEEVAWTGKLVADAHAIISNKRYTLFSPSLTHNGTRPLANP